LEMLEVVVDRVVVEFQVTPLAQVERVILPQ
jgi:hypothetical protein